MADYISTLTGVQMDAALIDMAEHNSEAYAVGERNGIPVGSGDVTYENNARYYASQAQSIAPASVTEAVRWDIAQTALTDANKAQARENIDAGKNGAWTNPNLLDNPFFTVRQRGNGPFNGAGFTVDRWSISGSSSTLTANSGYISLNMAANAVFLQRIGVELELGKPYTASLMEQDGTIYSATFTPTVSENIFALGPYICVFDARAIYAPNYRFYIYKETAWTADLKAAKLELGSVSTLANDVPPDYASELAKCKYYFNRVYSGAVMGSGWATSATNVIILLPVPQMRTTPTLSVTSVSTFRMKGAGGVSVVPSAVTINSASQVGVCINVTISGATTHDLYCLSGTDATAYIDLSADL